MEMNKEEMVRQALLELGEASSQELAMFIEQRHGVRIEARYLPVLRASLRGQEMLQRARQAARASVQTAENPGSDSEKNVVAVVGAPSQMDPILATPVNMPSGQPGGGESS